MKRLPLIVTVLAVVLLSASLAYWGLQLFKPQQRAIAAPPPAPPLGVNLDAAKGLFGGQVSVAAVSNYQLKGVVAAQGEDSAAIISIDNKPSVALAVGKEIAPGVIVKEVHARHVLLSEGGVIKRVDLPSDAGVSSGPASNLPLQPGARPPVQTPSVTPAQPAQPPQGGTPPSAPQPPAEQQNGQGAQGSQPRQTGPMGIPPFPTNNQ